MIAKCQIVICSEAYIFSDCAIHFCYWQFASRCTVRLTVKMSQRWVTLNQPPRKADVENYTNSDQNIVWQELLRKNQLKSSRQCQRFPSSKYYPYNTGESKHLIAHVYLQQHTLYFCLTGLLYWVGLRSSVQLFKKYFCC